MLKETQIIGTIYFIIASPTEGAIITRSQEAVLNERYISEDDWFLIQTNEDHFEDICNQRCKESKAKLEELRDEGRLTATSFRNEVMLEYPIANKYTIYDALMVPAQDVFEYDIVLYGYVDDFGN